MPDDISEISFRAAVENCLASGVTPAALADEFKVCTATIRRWRSGRSVPMPFVRQVVSERLVERLAAMLSASADECGKANPCCDRADEYNGFGSDGPLLFACPKDCPCHD